MRYLYRVLILGLILFNYSFASDTLLTINSYGPVKIGMTSNQAYGWSKPTLPIKRLPKKSCAETKYADRMYQAGFFY